MIESNEQKVQQYTSTEQISKNRL